MRTRSVARRERSAVHRTPPEIILEFAQYFDRPSLFSPSQVCRQWREVIGHLLWFTITKEDWRHSYFSNTLQKASSPSVELSLLFQVLLRVQSLEWHDNFSLQQTTPSSSLRAELSTTGLAVILSRTPNLGSLTL
ncbi:hypothetical protein BGX33_012319 [Mortierella sp. NVP41]|nr:hypothetical protein BGX33_012319 [Mortierella sp. NVP41]